MNKGFFIYTFGCKMNEYDSERIASIFEQKGYMLVNDPQDAQFVVINTCSVRERPHHKVESYIGKLRQLKKYRTPNLKLGVMGCVAQQDGESLLKRFKNIDFVLGTDAIDKLSAVIDDVVLGRKVVNREWKKGSFSIDGFERKDSSSASVTIMKGCVNFCSYCIVPYVRGVEKSRGPSEIIDEVKRLADSGVVEITLLGQNVNSYGKGQDLGVDFPTLLDQVSKINGITSVKFITSHPKDFSKKLVETIGNNTNISRLVHLPLQSASDKILRLMNRGYTLKEYKDKLEYAVSQIPELRFSSDFILGFPTESELDFMETYNFVKDFGYETCYIFNYSMRPGTAAAKLVDDVPAEIKTERLERLVSLQENISIERYKKILNTNLDVFVEGRSKKNEEKYTGRTAYGKVVNFSSTFSHNVGETVAVKIVDVKRNSLYGEVE